MPASAGKQSRSASPEDDNSHDHDASGNPIKAPKDKECPFCHQPFTSSSLGRHLDLYIKPKNPKPADGIHDVHKIREIRGKITRRQPRGSLNVKKQEHSPDRSDIGADSPPLSRSIASSAQPPSSSTSILTATTAPAIPIEPHPIINGDAPGRLVNHNTPPGWTAGSAHATPLQLDPSRPIYGAVWQSTGVITGLPEHSADMDRFKRGSSWDLAGTRLAPIRNKSDDTQSEGDETGRAAQLALREVLDSFEAARSRESRISLWDFDFFGTTFPGLCLKLLKSPRLLFSLHPTSTEDAWPIEPPNATRLTSLRDAIAKRAEQVGLAMDAQEMQRAMWHVDRSFASFDSLSDEEKQTAWQLETLREYSKSQKRLGERTAELKLARQRAQFFQQRFEDALAASRLTNGTSNHNPASLPEVRPDIYLQGLSGDGPIAISPDVGDALEHDPEARAWNYERLITKWRGILRESSKPPSRHQQPPPPQPQPQPPIPAARPPPPNGLTSTPSAGSSNPSGQSGSPGPRSDQRDVRFLWDDGGSGAESKAPKREWGEGEAAGWRDKRARIGENG